MARDEDIISADLASFALQRRAALGGMAGSVRIERQYDQPVRKALDLGPVLDRARRLRRAMKSFRQ